MWRALRVLGVVRADGFLVNAAAERCYLVTSFQQSQETVQAYENTPKSANTAVVDCPPNKFDCIYRGPAQEMEPTGSERNSERGKTKQQL